jgi:hypothetical protein
MTRVIVATMVAWVLLGAAPAPLVPVCDSGQLLVSNGSGYRCKSVKEVLESAKASASWGAELVLPSCSSGQLLESEGFGRWRCLDRSALMPSCSSGETLRSEGSSGWRCERPPRLPSCSSGEMLVGAGGSEFRCEKVK